jgi:multidrug resistance efflux pump
MRYQILPIVSVLACASVAAWIWGGQTHAAAGIGEVEAVRVELHPTFEGVLEELPHPVKVFDAVQSGQVIARLDTGIAEAELRRLEQELSQMPGTSATSGPTTAPAAPYSIVQWYQARIDELRAQVNKRDIKAPISGTVMSIHRRPGETATLGKAILTIASDKGEYIMGYLREDHMIRPEAGMTVQIRTRDKPARTYLSFVESVGAQMELIPVRYWRNPNVQEWGRPIRVALPEGAQLAPAETLDLVVSPAH